MNSLLIILILIYSTSALNLEYLDPTKLQTLKPTSVQKNAALKIIRKYCGKVNVNINTDLFTNNKDTFHLQTKKDELHINASSGVAAVWGFNYYLKKYCKSHIGWQVKRIAIPDPLPTVDERVVASDRFRYYQNVCTYSYSFVWWNTTQWIQHVEWMALNGINLALSPVDQEAVWAKVYKQLGMTQKEIDSYFTGPAFLSWLRMGNIHGWGGPLYPSWHNLQTKIQTIVTNQMYELGMIPALPAFSGHVPTAFARIYPKTKFHKVSSWNNFGHEYCCGLFLSPLQPLFKIIGKMFLHEIISEVNTSSHIFTADPFNEIAVDDMTADLIKKTSKELFDVMAEVDPQAVWLVQNWMFVNRPEFWNDKNAKAFLQAVPDGRMLILDLEAEHRPQYNKYDMYYGQPFIWCMLHNFGGTLGMIGKIPSINRNVYETRLKINSTMIGVGLTPEGINQNYVVYDFMLETGWRKTRIPDLNRWIEDYAERRYGCNITGPAWRSLLQGVYDYTQDSDNYGHNYYIITEMPSFKTTPETWYNFKDIYKAWKFFAFASKNCRSAGFYHDLVDITRQALQRTAELIYKNGLRNKSLGVTAFNASINQFLDVLHDMEQILACNNDFSLRDWLTGARRLAKSREELDNYELNARNQITLWGPNGEVSDYASKQWAEMFHYYYIPRWRTFLNAALDAKVKNETFDEEKIQREIRQKIDKKFETIRIDWLPSNNSIQVSRALFRKWRKYLLLWFL